MDPEGTECMIRRSVGRSVDCHVQRTKRSVPTVERKAEGAATPTPTLVLILRRILEPTVHADIDARGLVRHRVMGAPS